MRNLFRYAPEAIENAHKIAERCNVTIEFGNTKLPHFEVPEGFTSLTYFSMVPLLCSSSSSQTRNDFLSVSAVAFLFNDTTSFFCKSQKHYRFFRNPRQSEVFILLIIMPPLKFQQQKPELPSAIRRSFSDMRLLTKHFAFCNNGNTRIRLR